MSNIPFTKEYGYIRLARILKAGSHKLNEVMDAFGDIERVNGLKLKEWIESGILSTAELARIERIDNNEVYEVLKYCKLNNIRIITPEDEEYPPSLRVIENPPAVLFARGKRLDPAAPTIGIVGARKSTEFGQKAAYSLAAKLALSGFTVISGGALGVDSMAHTGAMNAGGDTVVILGCGIDSDYLPVQEPLRKRAEQNGTVISEFEPKAPATRYTFPIRNRLISALSSGVAVIEAGLHSGALITATYAMEQGKEIFALPGNIDQPQYGGTNELLRDGAVPLLSADDIIEVYIGRFGDKLGTGGVLSRDVKQGYYKEAERISGKRLHRPAKPNIDIVKTKNDKILKAQRTDRSDVATKKTEPSLKVTPSEEMACGEDAKKIYAAFENEIELSDFLSDRSGVIGGDFIAAITELEIFGYIKAVPVGRYQRIK